MNLFLFLQAKPIHEISFEHPYTSSIKGSVDDLICFEADQFSDQTQVSIGNNFISEAEKIIVWVEIKEGTAWNQLAGLFEKLRKSKAHKMIVCNGESPQIRQMLKMIGSQLQEHASFDEVKDFLMSD